jgi:hypothetical protein
MDAPINNVPLPDPANNNFAAGILAQNDASDHISHCAWSVAQFPYTDPTAAPQPGSDAVGSYIQRCTECASMDTLSHNMIIVVPSLPIQLPAGAPPTTLNRLGAVFTWVLIRVNEDAMEFGDDGEPFYLNFIQCTFLGIVGAICNAFSVATHNIAINSPVTLRIEDPIDFLFRRPVGALLASLRGTLATADADRVLNSPLAMLSAADIIQRQAIQQTQAAQLQLDALHQMHAQQHMHAMPAHPVLQPQPAFHTFSANSQRVMDKASQLELMFDDRGMWLNLFFPKHIPTPNFGDDDLLLQVLPAALPARPLTATFHQALQILASCLRVNDTHIGAFTNKSLSTAQRLNVVEWIWTDGLSISDFFTTDLAMTFSNKLILAFQRLATYVIKSFGNNMATALTVLQSSIFNLHMKNPVKLPQSFLIRLTDRQLETLRAESVIGPLSTGLNFSEWACRHVCKITTTHPSVREQLDIYVPSKPRSDVEHPNKKPRHNKPFQPQGNVKAKNPSPSHRGAALVFDQQIPRTPPGQSQVCNAWIRQLAPCQGLLCQGQGKTKIKRQHSFDGWDPQDAAVYRAAVESLTRSQG